MYGRGRFHSIEPPKVRQDSKSRRHLVHHLAHLLRDCGHFFFCYLSRGTDHQQPLRLIGFNGIHRNRRSSRFSLRNTNSLVAIATSSPPLTELRLLSAEFYCCRIGRYLSVGIAPGKSAHPRSPFCAMVSDRIEPSRPVARNSHY